VRKLILPALLLLVASYLYAQDDDAKRVEALISQAQAELQSEEKALQADKEKFSATRKELDEKISTLRAEGATLRREVEETGKNNQGLREEIESAKERIAADSEVCARLSQFAQEASEELKKKSALLPASRFGGIPAFTVGINKEESYRRIGEIFTAALQCIDSAESVTFTHARVLAEDGREKPARFLTVGGLTQVYLTEDGKESGALLYSEEGGRKFQHHLPHSMQSSIKSLFGSLQTGKEQTLLVPLDVTQEMVAGTEYGFKGIADWFVRGGPVMIPIALVALLAAIMIVHRSLILRRESASAEEVFDRTLSLQKDSAWDEASQTLRTIPGALAAVIAAGIENRQAGAEKIEEAMHQTALTQIGRLERFLPTIAVLATVEPLLGLLGTVTGMIRTFNTIAAYGSSDPRMLSAGISEALITTEAGLMVAIPVILIHSLLSSRVDGIIERMEKAIARTVSVFPEKKVND
jgi:biopolymer transport protein ExbB